MPIPTALTIAGSDSGGGAGIQADLKTFTAHGVYGASVLTALTAQNSRGVQAIHAPPAAFVAAQLESVLSDLDVRAAKTGMLFSAEIIDAVADGLAESNFPLVVDPVCAAASGDPLLQPEAIDALRERMLPLGALVTPNRAEAELLTDMTIGSHEELMTAIDRLLDHGSAAVLVKGGHFDEGAEVVDWLGLPGREPLALSQPRVDTPNVHGTGCTLSAAIAAYLALGHGLEEAIRGAQAFLNRGLRSSFRVGSGPGPVNHLAGLTMG